MPVPSPDPDLDTHRLDELRDLDPGETAYLDRAIGNFLRNSAAVPEILRGHIAREDHLGLRNTAHKLLGSALNLGVRVAVEPLRAVEEQGEQGSVTTAEALLPALEVALETGCLQLTAYQRTYSEVVPRGQVLA